MKTDKKIIFLKLFHILLSLPDLQSDRLLTLVREKIKKNKKNKRNSEHILTQPAPTL